MSSAAALQQLVLFQRWEKSAGLRDEELVARGIFKNIAGSGANSTAKISSLNRAEISNISSIYAGRNRE